LDGAANVALVSGGDSGGAGSSAIAEGAIRIRLSPHALIDLRRLFIAENPLLSVPARGVPPLVAGTLIRNPLTCAELRALRRRAATHGCQQAITRC
jgi:hypothetical protein